MAPTSPAPHTPRSRTRVARYRPRLTCPARPPPPPIFFLRLACPAARRLPRSAVSSASPARGRRVPHLPRRTASPPPPPSLRLPGPRPSAPLLPLLLPLPRLPLRAAPSLRLPCPRAARWPPLAGQHRRPSRPLPRRPDLPTSSAGTTNGHRALPLPTHRAYAGRGSACRASGLAERRSTPSRALQLLDEMRTLAGSLLRLTAATPISPRSAVRPAARSCVRRRHGGRGGVRRGRADGSAAGGAWGSNRPRRCGVRARARGV
ncbi:hypothetical protein ACP70R_033113 [Stipagrostis hirtigluma subsp. patula]